MKGERVAYGGAIRKPLWSRPGCQRRVSAPPNVAPRRSRPVRSRNGRVRISSPQAAPPMRTRIPLKTRQARGSKTYGACAAPWRPMRRCRTLWGLRVSAKRPAAPQKRRRRPQTPMAATPPTSEKAQGPNAARLGGTDQRKIRQRARPCRHPRRGFVRKPRRSAAKTSALSVDEPDRKARYSENCVKGVSKARPLCAASGSDRQGVACPLMDPLCL